MKVTVKNKKLNAIPISGEQSMNFKPYKNVNSLTPTPPTVIGNTETIEDIKNSTKNSTIGIFVSIAKINTKALNNCINCTTKPKIFASLKYFKNRLVFLLNR